MIIQRTVVFFGDSLDLHWVFWWFFKDLLRFLVDRWASIGFFGGPLHLR